MNARLCVRAYYVCEDILYFFLQIKSNLACNRSFAFHVITSFAVKMVLNFVFSNGKNQFSWTRVLLAFLISFFYSQKCCGMQMTSSLSLPFINSYISFFSRFFFSLNVWMCPKKFFGFAAQFSLNSQILMKIF